ncbi:asparagine synthetase [Pseudozyma hubeiensis SY62]|uniref:Asparagine synthetase n=1 Tax=Pseudozyma hubeiensis (strain SY62) TaxID=1305764 RepID=R9NYF5_PSEHS|nr:asparagine synthetase [Pseudozyma hubeiensis SY62]GAC93803.1 asparagine synthetase [Pseudozyma hubeiensis SY62]
MCGIGVLISPAVAVGERGQDVATPLEGYWPSVLDNIRDRGPDCSSSVQHEFRAPSSTAASSSATITAWTLSLTSSVLSLRGDGITQQPLTSSDGQLLLAWNGQIFDWDSNASSHATSSRVRLVSGENDGIISLDRIQQLLDQQKDHDKSPSSTGSALNAALSEIEGPYAFVLLDRRESKLYFGRDPLGRRSLLLQRLPQHSTLAIVSVAGGESPHGLDPEDSRSGATLTEIDCSSLWHIDLLHTPTSPHPLPRLTSRFNSPLLLRELQPADQQQYDPPRSPEQIRQDFLAVLSESVRRRVTNIDTDQPADEAHVAILFSGGLDCTTLALLADRHVPKDQPIDLLNVGFENVRAIEAAKLESEKRIRSKLKAAQKGRKPAAQTRDIDIDSAEADQKGPATVVEDDQTDDVHTTDIYAVPDRLTGISSYTELLTLSPHRRWNFVCINIPYSEYTSHKPRISSLMSPASSVMDLSIASALFFASRSRGHLLSTSDTAYTSPAKVLISGLGADELLAGYSRHRQAYNSSLQSLVRELQMDLDRLPTRNLGRDDRILSSHGKECRYPFLDRTVIEFLTSIPVEHKVNLVKLGTEGAGGDKRLLRDVAKELGLVGACELKKRAMQFGTRSAKIDGGSARAKGHHRLA